MTTLHLAFVLFGSFFAYIGLGFWLLSDYPYSKRGAVLFAVGVILLGANHVLFTPG